VDILQGDENLVSEFVANQGLSCLLDIGQKCDQTCQQYVLKGEYPVMIGMMIERAGWIGKAREKHSYLH